MCGIVGYAGARDSASIIMAGLARLEYRGYDSAGIATVGEHGLAMRKKSGKLAALHESLADAPLPAAPTGIGHTRWATHGAPTDENAHPHLADSGRLALIHNGIIENYGELRRELESDGVAFASETDSEVAAALIGREYERTGDLEQAFRAVLPRLEGAFTLLAVHANQPGIIVAARRNSPLVIGLGDGENYLGSDVAAFVEHTRRAVAIGQDNIVTVTPASVTITDFAGTAVAAEPFDVSWDAAAADKGGWPSFMAKEVAEEPEAVANTLRGRVRGEVGSGVGRGVGAVGGGAGGGGGVGGEVHIPELDGHDDLFVDAERIVIVACGTASYAALVGKYALENWARIPVDVELAHEFRYRDPIIGPRTLVVSISQSGETMDTLMAVRFAREKGARTLAICNTQGATIPRESDAVIYTHAGPEVAVASTKAFVAQITALMLVALHTGRLRGTLDPQTGRLETAALQDIPDHIATVLAQETDRITELAHWMADTRSVLFLGRHVGYPIALEGALKLKEISYIHAEGFAAGELKHGPIALIEPGQPVFVIVPSPRHSALLHAKVVSNIQEIRARGARVIAIAEEGDAAVLPHADEVIRIPLTTALLEPLLTVVPLQIFAMALATAKGLDVDQPRNLAKSVTVE
ncbi:glutamine--fructose-6-phosphate transaminase (isomerizing) [Microbacterium sp. YY-01]|uniref:glutamine--fructose-6-phosphate transaminase (isomerizing) n=1 Tax=Microbacterium sp. YY-01 TaxID=3421634 RepID=UPI003D174064